MFQKALAIAERLAAAHPEDTQAQRDLGASYDGLGYVTLQLGRTQESLGFYQKALAIAERLAAADPGNAQVQRALSVSYNKLGDLTLPSGRTQEAIDFYQKALTIRERLAADPENAAAQRDLGFNYYLAARGFALLSTSGDRAAREKAAGRAVELLRQAVAKGFNNVALVKQLQGLSFLRDRDDFEKLLADLEKANPPKK